MIDIILDSPNKEQISFDGKNISISLLTKILEDEEYYLYAKSVIDGEKNFFAYKTKVENYLKKDELGYLLKKAVDSNKIKLTEESRKKYNYLINYMSFENFWDNYNGIVLNMENTKVFITDILEPICKSDEEYQKVYDNLYDRNKEIVGINSTAYYKILRYIAKKIIFGKYMLSDIVYKRLNEIISDGALINQYYNNQENKANSDITKVNINRELKEKVLKEMPDDLNNLEKSIYIYIKLCQILIYDELYYITKGSESNLPHSSLNDIQEISIDKNEVVCFDFNMIYAKILNDLGINFNIVGRFEDYSKNHESLEMMFDNCIVMADSLMSFFKSDLSLIKLGLPIEGLYCATNNENGKKVFLQALDKIYKKIILNEDIKYGDILDKYEKQYKNPTIKVSMKDRINILMQNLTVSKLKGLDNMSYAYHLKKSLFSSDEIAKKLFFEILFEQIDNKKSLCVIIGIGRNEINLNEENLFYLYDENGVREISKDEIIEKIKNGELENNLELERIIGMVDDDREIKAIK